MAGQGTVGLELVEQLPEVDVVVVPVGGGGLLSGMLIAIKTLRPEVTVIAAEPAWADDTYRSLKSGTIQSPERYDTIGDGLRTRVGDLTFPIIQEHIDDILLAEESEIAASNQTDLQPRPRRRRALRSRPVSPPSWPIPVASEANKSPASSLAATLTRLRFRLAGSRAHGCTSHAHTATSAEPRR